MKFKKFELNPILEPIPFNTWESKYVFNPGVVYGDGLFHMLYRAQGPDMVSRLGYAVSKDGISFNRFNKPVLEPENDDEIYGVEDPRIAVIDGKYHVCYTSFSPESIKVGLALTENFISWERRGIILDNFEKDAALFPEKINGKYAVCFSIQPDMYISFSEDLQNWETPIKIASPRKSKWDNLTVGAGSVPVKTESGWLLLYHGSSFGVKSVYRLGLMLLDQSNPSKILKRSEIPILEPELSWEKAGGVPNVVFSCSMIEYKDKYHLYYGGADSKIGLATAEICDVYEWLKN